MPYRKWMRNDLDGPWLSLFIWCFEKYPDKSNLEGKDSFQFMAERYSLPLWESCSSSNWERLVVLHRQVESKG